MVDLEALKKSMVLKRNKILRGFPVNPENPVAIIGLIDRLQQAEAELEAARKHGPAGMVVESDPLTKTSVISWINGVYSSGDKLYASPVPAQQSADVTPEYPMQPMFLDNKGLPRFEKNPIVDWLCEKHGLNEIGIWWQVNNIERKYIEQLYQLIGYSIRGYEELSDVSDSSFSMAHEIAEQLLKGGENER